MGVEAIELPAMLFPLVTPEIVMGVRSSSSSHTSSRSSGPERSPRSSDRTFSISFVVVIVRGRLFSIGRQYEEAAADLGASPTVALTRVPLPPRPLRSSRRPQSSSPSPPTTSSSASGLERRRYGHRADQDLQCDAFCAAAFDERDRDDHDGDHVAHRLRLRRLALPHSRGAPFDAKTLPVRDLRWHAARFDWST